jgi:hypothetical protein
MAGRGEAVTQEQQPSKSWLASFQTHLFKWLMGLAVSVIVVLALGADLPEYIAHLIHELRMERLSNAAAQRARDTARTLGWRGLDSIEWTWLEELYGKQQVHSNQRYSYWDQPFKVVGGFAYRTGKKDGYMVWWPWQCNDAGCRYDLLLYNAKVIDASFVAVNPRRTDVFINGWMVFLNADGRFIVFDGKKYDFASK